MGSKGHLKGTKVQNWRNKKSGLREQGTENFRCILTSVSISFPFVSCRAKARDLSLSGSTPHGRCWPGKQNSWRSKSPPRKYALVSPGFWASWGLDACGWFENWAMWMWLSWSWRQTCLPRDPKYVARRWVGQRRAGVSLSVCLPVCQTSTWAMLSGKPNISSFFIFFCCTSFSVAPEVLDLSGISLCWTWQWDQTTSCANPGLWGENSTKDAMGIPLWSEWWLLLLQKLGGSLPCERTETM